MWKFTSFLTFSPFKHFVQNHDSPKKNIIYFLKRKIDVYLKIVYVCLKLKFLVSWIIIKRKLQIHFFNENRDNKIQYFLSLLWVEALKMLKILISLLLLIIIIHYKVVWCKKFSFKGNWSLFFMFCFWIFIISSNLYNFFKSL